MNVEVISESKSMKLELIIDLSIFLSFIFVSVQDINYVSLKD